MMVLISTRNRVDGMIPVCVTEKDSDAYKKYCNLNEQAIQKEIESYRKPFDDYSFMSFNMGREIADKYRGDFESFFIYDSGPGCGRDAFFEEGVDAMKRLYPYQCILDYWRTGAVYNLWCKSPEHESGNREAYKAFEEKISDREALESMMLLGGPYIFTEVELCLQ